MVLGLLLVIVAPFVLGGLLLAAIEAAGRRLGWKLDVPPPRAWRCCNCGALPGWVRRPLTTPCWDCTFLPRLALVPCWISGVAILYYIDYPRPRTFVFALAWAAVALPMLLLFRRLTSGFTARARSWVRHTSRNTALALAIVWLAWAVTAVGGRIMGVELAR